MAGVDVLEQAVLDAVGRDEHHAGGVPGLLVQQHAHRLGATAGDVFDVGDQVERAVAPGRYSRMSNTPWPAGSRPVRKVGQAAQEWEGRQERDTPLRPRAISV